MREIKCPNCEKVFQVDETGYAQIVKQVHDSEFEKELALRCKALDEQRISDLKISRMEHDKILADAMNEKDRVIAQLQARIDSSETARKLAVNEAIQEKEKQLNDQSNEITRLEGQLKSQESENKLKENSLKEQYEFQLKMKDEEIERYKDFKARMSTKMIGESLEQHCMTQFNTYRMAGFPNAYFEKDNDASSGSKGDFIFRDYSEGLEYISIMFEMKNEMDTTASKHKNEDFFKELDKDRREKNCEYAVLVSLLEPDNELYNNGIVDVSYKYEKMYVIRPQFFIPIITLLRNAALNSLNYQRELQIVKNQQLDLQYFEENMNTFKNGFAKNYDLASRQFQTAVEDIDKTIKTLEKIKDNLLKSSNNLRLANDKAQDLSIKKLTKNAPSVRAMFEEIKQDRDGE
ncbi:MAG: DUF2130 domain-containing protein [Clostridiales bacterium]|nr:DUF2130 domain-containing protein [Clostridiales bacterium]